MTFFHEYKTFVKTLLFSGLVLLLFFSIVPNTVHAQTDFGLQNVQDQGIALSSQPLDITIVKVIRAVLGFLGLIAVIIVLYGGYVYMTSNGNEDKVSQAKMILRNALIGLTIVFFSFAIVQFILLKLNAAAGGVNPGDTNPPPTCTDVQTCNYNPCDNVFVAQSITPSRDKADINNIVIRAVFTKSVETPANEVFFIQKDTSVDVTRNFTYHFVPGTDNKVIEAIMPLVGDVASQCSAENYVGATECIPLGEYTATINDTVVATDGEGINFGGTACQFEGMKEASFGAITQANDIENPTWQGVGIINPETNSIFTDPEPHIPAGETYTFVGSTNDDNGIAYVHFHLEATDGSETPFDMFRGPSSTMSSADPYSFSRGFFFSTGIIRQAGAPKQYQYSLTTWDIDHHVSETQTGTFVLVGNHCFNGEQDVLLGEYAIDKGGECGTDGACTENYQCASGLCLEGQCVSKPNITAVDPMDGAPGNWVTIRGYYFGLQQGTVEFGTDDTGWIPAHVVECSDVLTGSSWNNTYIIAEVPDNTDFDGTVSEAAIRITNTETNQTDATNDTFGVKPIYTDAEGIAHEDGLFRFNTTVRPGLCAVVVDEDQGILHMGDKAGPPGTTIRAIGTGFGDTQETGDNLTFGITGSDPISAEIFESGWTASVIHSIVPLSIAPGNPLIHVQKGEEISNGVPFRVSQPDLSDVKPLITDIDPSDPTPGSFVTIFGDHFGLAGYVYISRTAEASCTHGSQDDTCIELEVPPAPCKNTWTNSQIIVNIPDDFSSQGNYYVTVERADNGLTSDGTLDTMSIQNGAQKPSICELDPMQGPALLPEEHPGLLFSGKNFTTNPSLYFWNGSGDISDTSTVSNLESSSWIQWNSSSGDDRWNVNTQGTQIHSSVANVPASRYPTMPLGKWPIVIEANNNRGNSVNYFVTDCRIQGSTAPAGTNLQCCPEGPDAGSWKTICEGDVRSSGYVWRFTTGIPPKVPYVLVQCNSIGDTMNPSPVPSVEWEDSEKMCLNATAEVAFSTDIDPATITADAGNVLMYTCGSTDSAINCTYDPADRVTDLDLTQQFDTNGTVLIIKQSRGLIAPNFEPNTWYRVLLTTGVTSIAQDVGGGNSTSTPLRVDRVPENPAYTDADIAFYYDFQTGSGLCSLNSAYITPPEKTVTQIGPLPDVRNADLPFYYYLKGRADRKCTVLNVDDLGWNWSSNRETKATIAIAPSIDYADTRATSTAIEEAADGVTFGAFASTVGLDLQNTFPNGIKANTSTLFINIGPPHVVSYEPNCSASCRDAIIKASFSRHMDPSTYNSGIKVYKCADPNCTDLSEIGVSINVDSKLEVKITPVPLLDPNSYYKVEMTSAILSFGGVNLDTRDGQTLIPFSWVFRTKDDNTLCGVDHVSVTPHPFTATYIGQKTKFTAIPYGAPNECSPKGQELSQASYTYRWDSTVPAVATTTQFAASLTGSSGYCSGSCVPLGSDVTFEEKTTPICGNRIVDAGEDCDIAVDGETVGLTCTLSCLRPGIVQNSDTQPYCGSVQHEVNNPVEHALDNTIATGGEMCDPLASVRTSAGLVSWQPYCTNDCLKKGSSQNFNPNTSGYCGDGLVGLEESCDIGIPFVAGATNPNRSAIGCSRACLHIGTPISEDWCASHADNQFQYVSENDINVACQAAKSVCGNGRTESGEQCEAVDGVLPANCSDTCLLKSTCESATPLCDPAEEDCTSSCLLGGSSLFYSIPSVCGDGVVGLGEYASCEIPQSVDSSKQGGQQLTTAVGQGPTENNKQETTIEANIPAESVTGHADYTLQCGFTEYEAPKNGFYNDCVLPTNGEIGPNGLGVATNSCCYPRPMRTDEYPADGAGDPPICRNTYISVTFDKTVDPQSIAGNAIVARGYYDSGVNCADAGGTDVTLEVSTALHLPSGVADASAHGFWSSLWQGVKNFFYSLVQKVFAKDVVLSDIHTWCSDGNLTTDVTEPSLTIPLYLPHAIGSETEHTAYAVLLRGGMAGIRDINGVGIKHPTQSVISDAWTFEVGTEICKIDQVFVDPTSHLFILPNTSTSFGADAVTVQGQKIVSTPAYSWRWEWQPQQSTIFHIPADNASSTSQFTKMGSTNVEGNVTAVAQAIITRDQSTESNQLGNVFKGNVSLTSKFCENPWPSRNGEQWEPYRDTDLNYSFSYCADAGQSGSTGDDLPFLQINDIALTDASPDVLKRLLFVSDTNTDALGIQIFANPQRLSVASWFADRFPDAPLPEKITIGGYEGIASQDNYYINALNVVKDADGNVINVYNNIYLFTISQAAQAPTREVFQHILDSLEFNTNLTEYGYCIGYDGHTPDFEHACNNDFDCMLGPQTVTIQQGSIGTCEGTELQCVTSADCTDSGACIGGVPEETQTFSSAGCSAEKTKLLRDWERLHDIQTMQSVLGAGPYPALNNGTFRPNYVSSVWASWGAFGDAVGVNLPQDPINIWSGCDPADPQTCWNGSASTFICPQQASVYEYKYNDDTKTYAIHMPFEFFKSDANIKKFFAPTFISNADAFTTERECQPGDAYTFTTSQCGDGVVGPGEQCDPPGSSAISSRGIVGQSYGTCAYSSDQCLYNTDCGTKYQIKADGIQKTVYTGFAGSYCGMRNGGGPIVNNVASVSSSNTYTLFSCQKDEDCQDVNYYLQAFNPITTTNVSKYDTIDIGAKLNPHIDMGVEKLGVFLSTAGTDIGCLKIDNVLKDQFVYASSEEQCLGAVQDGSIAQCPTSPVQFATKACNNTCQWNYGACQISESCGNGRVEGNETCDDGGLNGQYGQCNTTCDGLAKSCGDGNIDAGYEICDFGDSTVRGDRTYNPSKLGSCRWDCQEYGSYCGDGVVDTSYGETCDVAVDGIGAYNLDKNLTCAANCRNYGSYCGDGVTNTEQGETCDDGNNTDGDGCNNSCIIEEGTCSLPYPQDATACIVGQNMCPYISFGPEEDTKVIVDSSFTPVDTVPGKLCAFKDTTCIGAAKMSVCNDYYHMLYSRADVASSAYVYGCSEDTDCRTAQIYGGAELFVEPGMGPLALSTKNKFSPSYQFPEVLSRLDNVQPFVCVQRNAFVLTASQTECLPIQNQPGTTIPAEASPSTPPSCGNGVLDSGEQCDPADQNTKSVDECTNLGYGTSCTYCSNTCTVETVDAQAYCGNEQIDKKDFNVYESCEKLADGSIIRRDSQGNIQTLNCNSYEYGSVSCTNSCTNFVNGCFNCGTSDTGAEAYVSLVNPMLAPNSAFPFTDIFRIGLDKQGFLGDISVPTRMLTNLYDQGSPFLGVMKNIPLTGGIGGINTIETNNQCNATCTDGSCGKGYYITFGQLTSVSDQGWRNFEQFPYTVSGQISTVSNEYVVSPSVPEGSIRVVIRWGAAEESQGANMRGYVYTRPNGAGDTSTSLLAGPVDTILHPDYLCKEAVVSGNASIPSGCSADQGMLYIHPETGLTNTFVQASTMNFGDAYSVSEEPLAFAVRNQDGPIAPWKNQTILVDVYTYHAGQTINSIFTPTFSYQIKTAASTSSNEGAQWWHVFTLVPKSKLLTSEIVNGSATDIEGTEYALVPIQSLETDDCEFHNNIYTNKIDCS